MAKRSSGLAALAATLGLGVMPACADTIYSCAGKDGAEVLQNMPCQPGAEVWAQPEPRDSKASTPTASAGVPDGSVAATLPEAVTGDAASAGPGMAPAAGEQAAADGDSLANLPSEPTLGMTKQQVKAILGEPTAITQEEVVQGNVVTWTYGDSRVLQFDTSGRLTTK